MEFPPESLKALWAPWRVEYFKLPARGADFLTEAAQSSDDAAHLVVARARNTFLILNRYPYAPGHMMAVPYREVADIADLSDAEKIELFDMAARAQNLLRKVMQAHGFNLGLNLGRCAGAGLPGHLHLHIVPRWDGDNNFMPVIGDVRVFPEALDAIYQKLMQAQEE